MHFVSLSQTLTSLLFFGLPGHFRTWHVEDQSAASVANLASEDRLSTFSSIFAKYRYAYTSPPYLILIVILSYIKGSGSLALRICITTISSSFYEFELRSVWGNETLCRIWFPNSIRSLSFHFLPSLQSYVCASKPNKLQLVNLNLERFW